METRKIVRNVIAVVLFSFLIIAFAVTGVTNDVLRPAPKDSVVVVGGREVSSSEFKIMFDQERESAGQQRGRPVTVDEAVQGGMDRGLLQELLNRAVFHELFDRIGLRVSPKIVANSLRDIPDFFDPVTGRFDTKAYQQKIGERGWTPARFEELMSGGIATEHFSAALQGGLKPPLAFGALQGAMFMENRDASFIFVNPGMVGAVPDPTEAQLRAFMNENAARLQLPERREISFVRLSSASYLADATADPAEVQRVVDFRKAQGGTPERRTIVQIPAKDRAAAQAISARLAKGEDPAAVAKSVGAAVVTYADKAKSDIPDRKIADAAFALPAGQVSGPIEGDLGFAVVKVTAITPGQQAPEAEIRAQAEAELKQRAAETKVTEAADKLEDAIAAGSDLETAARAAGLELVRTPAIDATGRAANGQPAAGLSAKLVERAFALPAGTTSEFETEQPGEYFIVRTDKVHPRALPPFEEIRPMLTESWKLRETDRRLTAKGNEVASRLRKGETIDAVAASLGTQPNRLTGVSQGSAQMQMQMVGQELVGAILQAKEGDVAISRAPQPGLFVFKVEDIKPGDPNEIARAVTSNEQQLQQVLVQEAVASFSTAAHDIVKGKSFLDRARAAIGAQPPAGQETGAKDKEKAG